MFKFIPCDLSIGRDDTVKNVDTLLVKSITVDEGPTMKRFRARAMGRGTRILKRMSHITIIVEEY